jgi:hypothetical protein
MVDAFGDRPERLKKPIPIVLKATGPFFVVLREDDRISDRLAKELSVGTHKAIT